MVRRLFRRVWNRLSRLVGRRSGSPAPPPASAPRPPAPAAPGPVPVPAVVVAAPAPPPPDPVRERVEAALAALRPAFQADDGDLVLVSVVAGVVTVAPKGRAAASASSRSSVRDAARLTLGAIEGVSAVALAEAP